jgi:uncharacterized protein (TIGR02246 family)
VLSVGAPTEPRDWPRAFTERVNAGDVDGILALYDPDARFVTPAGEILVGHEQLRRVLGGLVAAPARMESRVVQAIATADVAILYTDFHVTSVDASGATQALDQQAIEVLRRQPDGTWRLVVGDPNGRGR